MCFKKTVVCVTLALAGFASVAMAAEEPTVITDTSNGSVDFTGSIVNTPCAITSANQNLSVDLGQVKASSFTKKGDVYNDPKLINIVLSNCTVDATTPYKATVTFSGSGADTGKTALAVSSGSDTSGKAVATGVGIQILDGTNKVLNLDTASSSFNITKTEMNLPFSAQYVSVADTVSPGLANGHADFTVSYN